MSVSGDGQPEHIGGKQQHEYADEYLHRADKAREFSGGRKPAEKSDECSGQYEQYAVAHGIEQEQQRTHENAFRFRGDGQQHDL